MKRFFISILIPIFLVTACGKESPSPRYAPDSEQYTFFENLSDSMQISILDPDQSNKLIKTNEFTIYTSDIMPALYGMLSMQRQRLKTATKDQIHNLVEQAAKQEAEAQLLAADAQNNDISVSQDTIEAQLQKFYQRAGGKEKFLQNIKNRGFTMEYVKNDIKRSILIQKYLNDVIYSDLSVKEKEIQEAYDEEKTATVRHILLKTQGKSEAEKKETREKMEKILKRARLGEDFAKLAKEYSEDPGSKNKGGLYKNIEKGQMVKPFEKAAFNVPVGNISDIVETQYGYHIIKVISREEESRPLEEIRDKLTEELKTGKKRQVVTELIDSLKVQYDYQELFKG